MAEKEVRVYTNHQPIHSIGPQIEVKQLSLKDLTYKLY